MGESEASAAASPRDGRRPDVAATTARASAAARRRMDFGDGTRGGEGGCRGSTQV